MLTHTQERAFALVQSQAIENDLLPEQDGWEEEWDEWGTWDAPLEPSPWRRALTFSVIAILLIVFGLIAFWGVTGSDWLYGTYGNISQAQWDRMADLREQLVQLGVAPEAINALDDALLLPHPSTENVIFQLSKAAQALEPFKADAGIREIQAELQALISEIEPYYQATAAPRPTFTPVPLPTLTPIMDAPTAHGNVGLAQSLP